MDPEDRPPGPGADQAPLTDSKLAQLGPDGPRPGQPAPDEPGRLAGLDQEHEPTTGESVLGERRFCPIHGDYVASDEKAECPRCQENPFVSHASLRRVRVVPEEELAPGATMDGGPTPLGEQAECLSCGRAVPLDDFRFEVVGEVWTDRAAEFAEEGVCPDCYHHSLAPFIREWTDREWLAHHYESWRSAVEQVHSVMVFEERAQDAWLPEEERRRIVDVERTVSARREHLARCQRDMKDLQARYHANVTPPPFQMTLSEGAAAVSLAAIKVLKDRRADDLADLDAREDSVVTVPPSLAPDAPAPSPPDEGPPPPRRRTGSAATALWVVLGIAVALGLLALVYVLTG